MKRRNVVTSAALAAICLVLIIPIVVYGFPFIVGADTSYTVMSGSMSPALSPGDLLIVKGEESIYVGDIVTVESGEFTFTHRVIEKLEGDRFVLKGDANEDPDPNFVEASQIIGKVVMVFPFSHLYTPIGFVMALLVPAGLIIGNQMITVYQHTKSRNKKETMVWRSKNRRNMVISTSTLLLAIILTISTTRLIAPSFITGSSSYFSDTECSSGTVFSAGVWVFPSSITCYPEPSKINVSDSVTISGNIDPPHTAQGILMYSLDGTNWIITESFTVTDGSYSFTWAPSFAETYDIRVLWNGDYDHYPAISYIKTVTVVTP